MERWAECSAINNSAAVDWCGGSKCIHTHTHTHTHTHIHTHIYTNEQGHRGQSERDNEEVGEVLNGGCLTLTNEQESLKVGLHSLWPQFLISSGSTHTHKHTHAHAHMDLNVWTHRHQHCSSSHAHTYTTCAPKRAHRRGVVSSFSPLGSTAAVVVNFGCFTWSVNGTYFPQRASTWLLCHSISHWLKAEC